MDHFNCNTSSRNCKHFSLCERKEIEKSLERGFSIRAIASALGRAPSSVSREIKRNSVAQKRVLKYKSKLFDDFYFKFVYFADYASSVSSKRQKGRSIKILDTNILSFIDCKIKEKFSPSVISFLLKANFNISLSFKTIYNYIDYGILRSKNIDLLRKVRFSTKKRKKVPKRIYGTSIELRPDFINNRSKFGHWEGDCVVGKQHKSALLTLVERKTRLGLIFKLNEWNSNSVMNVLTKQLNSSNIFKSITFDNGSEFAKCMELEKFNTKIYFAHPYSSFERGSNENFNSMIRRFLPKGKDFRNIPETKLKEIQDWINNYPRKLLNFKSSKETYLEELLKIS